MLLIVLGKAVRGGRLFLWGLADLISFLRSSGGRRSPADLADVADLISVYPRILRENNYNPFTFLKIDLSISQQLKFTNIPNFKSDNFK